MQQESGNPAVPNSLNNPVIHPPIPLPHVNQPPIGPHFPQPPHGPPLLLGQGVQGQVQGIQPVQGVVGVNLGVLPGVAAFQPGLELPPPQFPPNM